MFNKIYFVSLLFITGVIIMVSGNAMADLWQIEAVDAPKYFTNFYSRAIAIDNNGHPHIAYGGDNLYYAYYDGTNWQYETVDLAPGVGEYASIAIDSSGYIHISYYDWTNIDLKYATNASGSWVIETVDSDGDVGRNNSIAIDSNDRVYISYWGGNTRGLKYATNASGSWVNEIVDVNGYTGHSTAIAIDSNDHVHITYGYYSDLKYATNATGYWVAEAVDTHGLLLGWFISIAIDSNDHIHISYYDDSSDDLKYATNASGSWTTERVDSDGRVGKFNSIAIDSNDHIHIGYRDDATGELKYATNASDSWAIEILDISGWVSCNSIAIDSNDHIHISYLNASIGDLEYATNASGWWTTETVDNYGMVGVDNSIAIDSNGCVHISYYDYINENLKYATNASGSWVAETVGRSGTRGYGSGSTSIAIDSNDHVHISYYHCLDDYRGSLKYATNTSGSWAVNIVDNGGTVGWNISETIDSNDHVHISYKDYINGYLKYATNASDSWATEIVDSSHLGSYNSSTSITTDSGNHVHISYTDSLNRHLKYVTNTHGFWDMETLDSSGDVICDTSIATDKNDHVHISYNRNRLMYVTNAYGSWVTETVDSIGSDSSIAIDSGNYIHISYFDYFNRHLKYATNAFGSWVMKETVDSTREGGYDNSIAIDSDDHIHISYNDGRPYWYLKYATRVLPPFVPVRHLPSRVSKGASFDVTVTFTAPEDVFNSIGLGDEADINYMTTAVETTWCDPDATWASAVDNSAEYIWASSHDKGTFFTAVYNVTVDPDTPEGNYTFAGSLEYYVGSTGPFTVPIYGDSEVEVIPPYVITGVTGEVDGSILQSATVDLYKDGQPIDNTTSDGEGNYLLLAPEPGDYDIIVSMTGFKDETQPLSIPEFGEYTLDFIGETGLVPQAPDMSYVLQCVNHWLYPEPPSGLSMSKLLQVVNTWLYPEYSGSGYEATVVLQPDITVTRDMPEAVDPGDTFDVTVTFTAPEDAFNSIGLSDQADGGYMNVSVNATWCDPDATFANAVDNTVEYVWFGPYDTGTSFTAVYKVTVDPDTPNGTYLFNGSLEYYIAGEGSFTADIGGDSEVVVGTSVPYLDIKANGSDGPLDLNYGDTLSITITLDPAEYLGRNGDWWICTKSPSSWWSYEPSTKNWIPGIVLAAQMPLFSIPDPYEVLNTSALAPGEYIFYFTIDAPDGVYIPLGPDWIDSVIVNVLAPSVEQEFQYNLDDGIMNNNSEDESLWIWGLQDLE